MTIWNALAAGGALWCVFLAHTVYVTPADSNRQMLIAKVPQHALACLGFGICLWGAIPQ